MEISKNINAPISLQFKGEYEGYNLSDYISCDDPYRSRIPTDKTSEDALINDYSGRELYEIIQNADDQKASTIEVELDKDHHLHIRNDGGNPFSNKGLLSVMRPHQSSKKDEGNSQEGPIGNKGLGIRSLLNWSNGLIIHSNGVRVAFSSAIARKKWEDILRATPALKLLDVNEKCPLAILSVPEVSQDDITSAFDSNRWTTEIEIACNSEVIEDIIGKMSSLKVEVLLFLKHVRKIILKYNGKETELIREDAETGPSDNSIKYTCLTEGNIKYKYAVFHETVDVSNEQSNGRISTISVAFTEDSDRWTDYLYSYFPTAIPLRLPCVIHADFQLTMSRNGLIENRQNHILMERLANLLIRAAEFRAMTLQNINSGFDRLLPLEMLTIDGASAQILRSFAEYIDRKFESCKVIPTIDGKFKAFQERIFYSPKVRMDCFLPYFVDGNLLNNYISTSTYQALRKKDKTPYGIEMLNGELSALAAVLSVEKCGDLIIELLNVNLWQTKPNLLRLDTGKTAGAEDIVYVIVSKDATDVIKDPENNETVAPKELNLKILDPRLSKILQKNLNTDSRGLTRTLRNLAGVQDADFSRVKIEIENKSTSLLPDEINGVINWLYKRWKKYHLPSSDADSVENDNAAPECWKFFLLNAEGNRARACSLMLDSDAPQFQLNPYHTQIIPEEDRIGFFINYLGCAKAIPVEPYDFSKEEEYIRQEMGAEWISSVQKCETWQNLSLIPVNDYIQTKSAEEIISLISRDKRFLHRLTQSNEIKYSYYGPKSRAVRMGFTTYWLTMRENAPLADIRNYVIPSGVSFDVSFLNKGIIDIDRLSEHLQKADLEELLVHLGAKTDPLNLSFAQLFKVLEQHDDPGKAQRVYKEIRSFIMEKEKKQNMKPTQADMALLKTVWAIGPEGETERKPKNEVYYWDNPRLPKQFLSSLWKICLGARLGEQSVHRLFGVQLLSNLHLQVIDKENYNRTLTSSIRAFLLERYRYFIAFSLSESEYKIETIRNKAAEIRKYIFSLRFSSGFSYEINDQETPASEGDSVKDAEGFYICTSATTMDDVLSNPQLCSVISSGLCLALLIDGDNEWRFNHIIQAPIKSIAFEWNEIDRTLQEDILRAIGFSDKDKRFWEAIGIDLDQEDINPDRKKYKILSRIPDAVLPDNFSDIENMSEIDLYSFLLSVPSPIRGKLTGLYSLSSFFKEQLRCEFAAVFAQYRSLTFSKVSGKVKTSQNINEVYDWYNDTVVFHDKIISYIDESYFHEFKDLRLLSEEFRTSIINEYPVLTEDVTMIEPQILPPYSDILSQHNVAESELTYEQKSIAYFEGFEKEFEEIVASKTPMASGYLTDNSPLTKSEDSISFSPATHDSSGHGVGTGGFTGSQSKYRAGKSAESKVIEYLKSHPEEFGSVSNVSEQHGYHCDLIYTRKGDPVQRFLEIKSVNGHKVFFSPAEIDEGKRNAAIYDIALVYNDKVKIITSAFIEGGVLLTNLCAASYEVEIEIDNNPQES